MIMAGFSEIGRKQYGCFPLKGKMINEEELAAKNLANTEIANLVEILGLPHPGGSSVGNVGVGCGTTRWSSYATRTRTVAHQGLIINFFHTYYPSC